MSFFFCSVKHLCDLFLLLFYVGVYCRNGKREEKLDGS